MKRFVNGLAMTLLALSVTFAVGCGGGAEKGKSEKKGEAKKEEKSASSEGSKVADAKMTQVVFNVEGMA